MGEDVDSLNSGRKNGNSSAKWFGAKFNTDNETEKKYFELLESVETKMGSRNRKYTLAVLAKFYNDNAE